RGSNYGIEIAPGERIGQIAEIVSEERTDQREVRAQGNFQQELFTVDRKLLLAVLDDRADARWRKNAAEPESTGADALDECPLGNQLDFHFFGKHTSLGFGIGADVTNDHFAQYPRTDKLA